MADNSNDRKMNRKHHSRPVPPPAIDIQQVDGDQTGQPEKRPDDKNFDRALFWLVVGGLFGFHHIYMKRTRQAVLYACTGGFFVVGLVYDLFHLENYLSESNFDEAFVENYTTKNRKKQGAGVVRCSVELIFGVVAGYVVYFALPYDWQNADKTTLQDYILVRINALLISPLATAFGVWFVGGIGTKRLSLSSAVGGALMSIPVLIYNGNTTGLFYTAIFSDFWANYAGRYSRSLASQFDEQEIPYRRHVAKYLLFVTAFYVMCIAAGVNNATIKNDVGEVAFRDFIWNCVRTPDFAVVCDEIGDALKYGDVPRAFRIAVNGGSSVSDVVIFSGILGLNVSTTSIGTVYQVCDQLLQKTSQDKKLQNGSDDARLAKALNACEKLMKRNPVPKEQQNEEDVISKVPPVSKISAEGKKSRNVEENSFYQGEKFMKFEL